MDSTIYDVWAREILDSVEIQQLNARLHSKMDLMVLLLFHQEQVQARTKQSNYEIMMRNVIMAKAFFEP
jgi:hypothetical protein